MAKLLANGINQVDLVNLINTIKTKWNAVMLKLDNDATLDVDTYVSGNALSIPNGIQISGVKAIRDQGAIVTFLNDAITQFNLVMAKLDADDLGGMDNDYASTLGITDVVGNSKIDGIIPAGIYQGSLIKVLNNWITNFNLLLAKLDADPLAASDYVATNAITDTVVEEGSKARPRIGALIIAFVMLGLSVSGLAYDRNAVFAGDMVNEAFTYTQAADLDLVKNDVGKLSIQVVYSTTTYSAATVTDGTVEHDKLTVSNTNLTGTTIRIAGYSLVHGVDFSTAATTTLVAKNVAAAIKAKAGLSSIVTATNTANVVYATATKAGYFNYMTAISSPAASWFYATFQGGTDSDISVANDTLAEVNTYPNGLALLFVKTAGTVPTGLTDKATYYVSNRIPASFKLSNTSTGSAADLYVNITATTTTGGGTFVLTPIKNTGTHNFKFQKSNDGSNWYDVVIATAANANPFTLSANVATPYTASQKFWDIGPVYFRYLRFLFTKGTFGNVNIAVSLSGKKY